MKAFTSNIYFFIHVKSCSLGNPTETHLVFRSNQRKNAHAVPSTAASAIGNRENSQKRKTTSYRYGMITEKMSKVLI